VPARLAQLTDSELVVTVNLGGNRNDPSLPVQFPMFDDRHEVVELPASRWQVLRSLITCMFLHGGWMHLIGNMWFFWIFGNNIEDRLGPLPFVLFYLLGGVAASLGHWAMTPASEAAIPVIGASGAVAVMLGAYAVTYPKAQVRVLAVIFVLITVFNLPALIVLALWFVFQLFAGMQSGGGVAWWAHVGGFVVGMAVMPLLALVIRPPTPRPRRSPTQRTRYSRRPDSSGISFDEDKTDDGIWWDE